MAVFSRQVAETLSAKLTEARSATGLSTRAVAERISSKYAVSHTSIANYEKGKSSPPLDVLAVLASVYERPLNWFLEPGDSLTGIQYRNVKSKVRVQDRHRYEGAAKRLLEGYRKLERGFKRPLQRDPRLKDFAASPDETGCALARRLRKRLGLNDDQPVVSVVEVLERLGIRTIELPTDIRIDGFAAKFGEEHVVVLNPGVSSDRARMNAAHELGHILFGDCEAKGTFDPKAIETRTFEFASPFLIPRPQLESAFQGRSMLRLVEFKERFGIALAAMIYRAEKEDILDSKTTKWLWIQFAKRGWRLKEPGNVWRDRAVRFEQLLESASREEGMTWRELETLTGIPANELRNRLDRAHGTHPDSPQEPEGDEEDRRILNFER